MFVSPLYACVGVWVCARFGFSAVHSRGYVVNPGEFKEAPSWGFPATPQSPSSPVAVNIAVAPQEYTRDGLRDGAALPMHEAAMPAQKSKHEIADVHALPRTAESQIEEQIRALQAPIPSPRMGNIPGGGMAGGPGNMMGMGQMGMGMGMGMGGGGGYNQAYGPYNQAYNQAGNMGAMNMLVQV